MTNTEREDGVTRDELVQRVALMEEMIAEGRRSTARFGWSFVLWGLVTLIGIGWQYLQPHLHWIWPVAIASGFLIQFIGIAIHRRRGRSCSNNMQSRSIAAVWRMTGIAIILYAAPAIVTHTIHQIAYVAAIFIFLGLAHAISALILRWRAQGVVAGLWWAGGIATYFVPENNVLTIYIAEMFFCMVLFGLYAMWLERRRAAALEQHHA